MMETKFKQTELGLIPMDWAVFRLGTISDIKTGPFGSSLHASDYVRYGTPIITVEHLGEPYILHATNTPLVGERDKKRLAQYSLRTGDIVYSRVGSVDRNSVVTEQEEGWLFSGRLLRVRNTFGYNASYLGYHLNSYSAKQRIISAAVGLGMPSINTKILGEHSVILPKDVNEQTRIAEALSDVDKLIRELDTLIEKKRSIMQGTMQELLTAHCRLPGFVHPWRNTLVEKCCKITTGESNTQDQIESGIYPFYIRSATVMRSNSYIFDCEGVITIGDGQIGKVFHYVNGKFDLHQRCYLMYDFDDIDVKFFYFLFSFFFYNRVIALSAKATVDSVRRNMIVKMKINIPSTMQEQKAIANILSDMNDGIEAIEAKRDKYIAVRQGMMQQLLTGKIRLI